MSTVGRNIGMGPIHYQKTGIIKCEEKIIKACETDSQCCSVVACEYCLEWDEYGEELVYGLAVTDESGNLSGEVAGFQFRAEWERTGYSDDCSLMVYVDDQIRGSIPLCANFITCRDVSAWVTVTDKDEYGNVIRDGVLRWDRRELRELPYRKDENRCTQKFCGNCDCTCRELCVTITDPEGAVTRGELPDISYSDCEGPVWAGMVGEYELSVELGRDEEDGSCIARVTTNGEESEWVEAAGCQSMSATWTLYDGTEIAVVCKGCDCNTDTPIDLPFCLCSPVGSILNFTMIGSGTGVCAFSGELTYQEEAILPTWISAPFTLPTKPTATEVTLRLFCDSTAGSLFPANGFTEEDAAEVNTAFWYSVGLYPTSGEGPRTTIPHYYRQPDDILGWVGRCRDGFFLVVRYLNDICGSVVGDGLVTVVITE
jgi:hypothetical protein